MSLLLSENVILYFATSSGVGHGCTNMHMLVCIPGSPVVGPKQRLAEWQASEELKQKEEVYAHQVLESESKLTIRSL